MSKQIDERVVSMRFDNAQFERNVSTSMSTLDKLKQKLNLNDSANAMANGVNSAVRKVTFDPMMTAVDKVQVKFSAWRTAMDQTVRNVVNTIESSAKRIVKSLTIDPVTTGFSEYELKLNSTKIIMASTGRALSDVNSQLEELNLYADKTIYSFSDMTNNIGKFTNAGVELEDAVAAIKGISNEAALSGASTQQASHAMYNFAQALSAGYVKLIDWKSIENAQMATVEFKEELIKTALDLGTLIKVYDKYGTTTTDANGNFAEAFDATSKFNESLSAQWMTSEVLTETLKKYADETTEIGRKATEAATKIRTVTQLYDTLKEAAQSGWARTWELVIGNINESSEYLTTIGQKISGVLDGWSTSRNDLFGESLNSSYDKILDKIEDAGYAAEDFEKKLTETAKNSGVDVDKLVNKYGSLAKVFSKGELGSDIITKTLDGISTEGVDASITIENLSKNFEAFRKKAEEVATKGGYSYEDKDLYSKLAEEGYNYAAVQDILSRATDGHTLTVEDLIAVQAKFNDEQLKSLGYTEAQIKTIRAIPLQRLSDLTDTASDLSGLLDTLQKKSGRELIFESLYNVMDAIGKIGTTISDAWKEVFGPMDSGQLYGIIVAVNEFTKGLIMGEGVAGDLKRTFKGLFAILDIAKQALVAIFKALGPPVVSVLKWLLSGLAVIGDWAVALSNLVRTSNIFGVVMGGLASILVAVGKGFKAVFSFLTQKILLPVWERLVVLFGLLKDGVVGFASGCKTVFSFLKDKVVAPGWEFFLTLFDRIVARGENVKDTVENVKAGVTNMAEALQQSGLAQFFDKIWSAIVNISKALGIAFADVLGGFIEEFRNVNFDTALDAINTGFFGALAIALAKLFGNIGGVVKNFSGIVGNFKDIGKSIVDVFKSISGYVETAKASLRTEIFKKLATSILILAGAMLIMSLIDSNKLSQAGFVVTALIAELMVILERVNKMELGAKGTTKIITTLLGMSVAVLILASAIKKIGSLDIANMWSAFGVVALIMGSFLGFLYAIPTRKADKVAGTLISLSISITIMATAMKILGSMSWKEMGIALTGFAVGLGGLIGALHALPRQGLAGKATGILTISAAMIVLAHAMKLIATMTWEELAKGLLGFIGAISALALALNAMEHGLKGAVAVTLVAPALLILAGVLKIMGTFSWGEIVKGLVALGGSLAILAAGLVAMKVAGIKGAIALAIVTPALMGLAVALGTLGVLSWKSITTGLIAMAGAFIVIGAAGAIIGPVAGYVLLLSVAIALLSASVVIAGAGLSAIGVGLTAIATGITALAGALSVGVTVIVGAIKSIIMAIADVVPYLVKKFGEAFVAWCKVIENGAPAIGEAFKSILRTIINVIVELVPDIAEGFFELIIGVIETLVRGVPTIAGLIFDFWIAIIDKLAEKIPEMIQSLVNLMMKVFQGLVDALDGIDKAVIEEATEALWGILDAMGVLTLIGVLAPGASVGIISLGTLVVQLGAILAGLGALARIDGLNEIIGDSGGLLGAIGTAIGSFIGGLAGGLGSAVASKLPSIGENLSDFMSNMKTFIEGASAVKGESIDGASNLVGVISAITKAALLEGITSWLVGEESIKQFSKALVPFGEAMVEFSSTVSGKIDTAAVTCAANAGKIMAEMAKTLPNTGGFAGWFLGNNDMDVFGSQLESFGKSIVKFSKTVSGEGKIDKTAVESAAAAGEIMSTFAKTLPNTGGVIGFIVGNNDMDIFGEHLEAFGTSMVNFSKTVSAEGAINSEAVQNAATAGGLMAALNSSIPKDGFSVIGTIVGWQNLSMFGTNIVSFGTSMVAFSKAISGNIDYAAINATTNVGQMMAALQNSLDPSGGVMSLVEGESSIKTLGGNIKEFGKSIVDYYDEIKDLNTGDLLERTKKIIETINNFGTGLNIVALTAATAASKALVDVANSISNIGGIADILMGSNDLATFGSTLVVYGVCLMAYGKTVENIATYSQAIADSAKASAGLVEVAKSVPNIGGLVEKFTGTNNLATFGLTLPAYGVCLMAYGKSVKNIATYSQSITDSVSASSGLIELSKSIPDIGGMATLFAGTNDMATFGVTLAAYGKCLMSYAESVSGIGDYSGAIYKSANASKAMVQVAQQIPGIFGLKEIWEGSRDLGTFGETLKDYGACLIAYGEDVKNISQYITPIEQSSKASMGMIQVAQGAKDVLSGDKYDKEIVNFGQAMCDYADEMKTYGEKIASVDINAIKNSTNKFHNLVLLATDLSGMDFTGIGDLVEYITELDKLGSDGVNAFLDSFGGVNEKATTVGKQFIQALINGIVEGSTKLYATLSSVVTTMVSTLESGYSGCVSAGGHLVQGFANGITAVAPVAIKRATSLAGNVIGAINRELQIMSPSRVAFRSGNFTGVGFIKGLENNMSDAYNAGSDIAENARFGLTKAVSKVNDILNSEADMQPTIRPVLDLSDVRAGAGMIGGMFGMNPSLGVLANVGTVNSMMNNYGQNGVNDDVVSAINKLGKIFGESDRSQININGVNIGNDDNIRAAIETIVRAARIEGRA